MFPRNKFVLLLCLAASWDATLVDSSEEKKLKTELLQVLFRHGARTPVKCELALLDNNATLYEPWGLAQLTNQGMAQEYQLGEMLRERYGAFLTEDYRPEFVYAYASGVSRTKASLELVLAALFPPTDKLTWNKDLRWLPVPTFSNPRPLDILIKARDCPKYRQFLKDLFDTEEMKQLAAEHDDILGTMEKSNGKKFNFDSLFCAYNAIVIHKNLNLPLPRWYSEEVYAKLVDAGRFYLEALSWTTDLKRLYGGTFVKKFLDNMETAGSKGRKIYLYSAHDKTLYSFAKSHNVTLSQFPEYGSAIILEKLRDENDKIFVRLLLYSGEPKTLKTLKLDGCAEVCEYDRYKKIVGPVIPSDEDMLCLLKNLQPKEIGRIFDTDVVNIED